MIIPIAIIIFFIGLAGMGIIIVRKISVLTELSPQEIEPKDFKRLREKIKNNRTLRFFSGELLLQKILSGIKVLTLRTENKTSAWLANSRQRYLDKKNKFSDDYWRRIRRRK